jgi:hypothetical protein
MSVVPDCYRDTNTHYLPLYFFTTQNLVLLLLFHQYVNELFITVSPAREPEMAYLIGLC